MFDRLTVAISRPPTRRSALRLLAGGVLVGLLAPRTSDLARAQPRPDRDGDGLFDDDEEEVYGTDPDVYDTDGDGVGDGEEIYNRDQGLAGPSDPLTPNGGDEAAPLPGPNKGLREICTPGVDICSAPWQCDAPTTRHTCSGTVLGVSAWCCVPPGGWCTECDCCGDYYCAYDDNNVPSCQPNPEG
jgi:hypothetical protein